ncbi:MAG: glyoxalase [Pseudomonadota bacterium]
MNYESVDPETFGASLRGMGLNLLVRDVKAQVTFLTEIFAMTVFQPTDDFAIVGYGGQVFQLHRDSTYHANPLLGLLPETPPRGAGIEIRLYDTDPEIACTKAKSMNATILQWPTDKPHGLREAYILCENGYAWVPSSRNNPCSGKSGDEQRTV